MKDKKCKHKWQFYVIPSGIESYYDTDGDARDWKIRQRFVQVKEVARCINCFKRQSIFG